MKLTGHSYLRRSLLYHRNCAFDAVDQAKIEPDDIVRGLMRLRMRWKAGRGLGTVMWGANPKVIPKHRLMSLIQGWALFVSQMLFQTVDLHLFQALLECVL